MTLTQETVDRYYARLLDERAENARLRAALEQYTTEFEHLRRFRAGRVVTTQDVERWNALAEEGRKS